jgi:hypothetical protein
VPEGNEEDHKFPQDCPCPGRNLKRELTQIVKGLIDLLGETFRTFTYIMHAVYKLLVSLRKHGSV